MSGHRFRKVLAEGFHIISNHGQQALQRFGAKNRYFHKISSPLAAISKSLKREFNVHFLWKLLINYCHRVSEINQSTYRFHSQMANLTQSELPIRYLINVSNKHVGSHSCCHVDKPVNMKFVDLF